MKEINLGLRFILELALLFSLGYWGFHVAQGILAEMGLGLGIPFAAAIIWGLFLSPRASVNISASGRLGLEMALFGFAVITLHSIGFTVVSIVFGMAFILNRYFLFHLEKA
ncbi:MAG TPA: YrdB family protein [Bacillales bacterium]|nr:YrdB family protein [Bacillales bacterium]